MKVDKQKFESVVGGLPVQKPERRENLKTGEKKEAARLSL